MLNRIKKLLPQFGKFGLIGVINTLIHILIVNTLSILTGITSGTGVIFIKSCAFIVANINSYFMNKKWTFSSENKENGSYFAKFLMVSIGGLLINNSVAYTITTLITPFLGITYFVELFPNRLELVWLNVATLAAIALSMIWNFIGYKLLVFKR